MSYCRFIDGDVYAFECEGGVQFWTVNKALDRLCRTYTDAYEYAKELRDVHGLNVPGYAIEALRADSIECEESPKLREENENLRELVEVLLHCMQIHKECDDCVLNGSKGELARDQLSACDGLHKRLRELGIEVDG